MSKIGLFSLAIAVTAVALTSQGHAKQPRTLEPSAAWTLDFADERCSLIRPFGEKGKGVTLQIDSFGSRSKFRVLLFGEMVPTSSKPTGTVRYGFSSDNALRDRVNSLAGKSGKLAAVSFSTGLYPDNSAFDGLWKSPTEPTSEQLERFQEELDNFRTSIASMTVEFHRGNPVKLETGSLEKPMEAMAGCIDNLVASWGIDVPSYNTQSRSATPLPSTVQRLQRHYPAGMASNGISAFTPVRIMVNEEGDAQQCVVQVASVNDAFKLAVCDGLARKFEPALDTQGKPVASVYLATVFFMLPY